MEPHDGDTADDKSSRNTSAPFCRRKLIWQRLLSLSRYRVFSFLFIAFMAAPLGPLIAGIIAIFLFLTSLSLPFLIGPLCISLYVTLFVYVTRELSRTSMKLMRYLVNSLKKGIAKHIEKIRRKTTISDESQLSTQVIQLRKDEPDKDNEQTSVDGSVSSDSSEEETQQDVYKIRHLNVRSLLHISRPRFYSVEEDSNWCTPTTEANTDAPSISNNGDGPPKDGTLYNKTESSMLLKNVAIIKHYPNEGSTMLEKLEDMRRILTNIRRRVSNRRSAHTHREHR